MTHRYSIIVSISALLVSTTVALTAQSQSTAAQPGNTNAQSSADTGTYRIQETSRLVLLDVLVTDAHGRIINNLGKDDFQVLEDNVPQTVHFFDHYQSPSSGTSIQINSSADLEKLEPTAPATIVVLDEVTTNFDTRAHAYAALRAYLIAQPSVLAQPTMIVAVRPDRVVVLRDYTNSQGELLIALSRHSTITQSQLGDAEWKAKEQVNSVLSALMEMADASIGHSGHKSIIWIGLGLPLASFFQSEGPEGAIRICTEALRHSRITLFAVSPDGVPGRAPATNLDGSTDEDPVFGEMQFNDIARSTGGRAYHGRNDIENLIQSSADVSNSFYTLSYIPATDNDQAKNFRKIRVIMKNPAWNATTRDGYYPSPPALSPLQKGKHDSDRLLALSVTARSVMQYDALPMAVGPSPDQQGVFRIGLRSSDIVWKRSGKQTVTADVTVVVESFTADGRVLNQTSQIHTVELPPNAEGTVPASRSVIMETKLSAKPPAVRLRFVVLVNDTGRIGAKNLFLNPAPLSNRSRH